MTTARVQPGRDGYGLMRGSFGDVMFAVTRVAIGFIFLWAFLDKLFGLGKSTPSEKSWLNGGSPTAGYLSNLKGTFADTFSGIAGKAWADWIFMLGLLGLGLALILGIGMMVAAIAGTVLLVLMWMTALPISSNPFLDDHIIYALVIIAIAATGAGLRYGLAPWWRRVTAGQRWLW
ncbi:thiosulfate dehydrogenase [quinone] large subunit [Allocatelliglobosispora scoriae]|uniref:Thiosulfate dehydrogenase [quinone] large subunit n=1 Tax=Allocatelliglobosispora scoriae TaxID=643052 RepID=A0A841BYQ8_9ACTN|nr:DoxX family membrane protein [Allocatelliglobosispora scoriae]MBB5873274.1 thiosulfate dehydrogenase [quinone] large subunit [Allocatelliglobosispora scoriae]